LGNLGLSFRHALALQKKEDIHSLRASTICKPGDDELLVIVGKAGAAKTGAVDESEVDAIGGRADVRTKVIWEAPLRNQQQNMILRFGKNASLGNIPTTDVPALEACRHGLRGDTFKRSIEHGMQPTEQD
jgi:phosphosulfolactate synthase (CoM biosynthesis protein A)